MHAGEVDTDAGLVRRLVAAQFPDWASLRIDPVDGSGTVNALYRLGEAMIVRLPRTDRGVGAFEKQLE
jgi:aminoglycoside phosphotransferase (APT) family kinase protein